MTHPTPKRLVALIAALLGLNALARPNAQAPRPIGCDDLLPAPRQFQEMRVGPESCLMIETSFTFEERSFRRVDVGLDGTVEGFLPKTGQYINYFTSAPDLVFPSGANPGPIYRGIGRYRRATGAAMTLVVPRARRAWNGKLWVTAHGRGRSFKRGTLRPWDKNLDPADPLGDLNKYDRLMLAKGYALAKTYRTSDTLGGDVEVTLEDGTFYPSKNLNDNGRYILDFTLVAERFLERQFGRPPRRTYFYGHSAGGRIGRSFNYVPGLNRGPDGRPLIDGILADDAATGLWLPVVMKDGRDVLFTREAERAAFVPQIDLTHQLYNAESPGEKAPWISTNYLENKRRNAKILRDKGLGATHRMYEIRGISHSGGETLPDGRRGDIQILDLSRMMEGVIDLLDAWVDRGVAPPPTRSDWAELGDADRDGVIEYPAVAFPEVACPLGVYFQYPPSLGAGGAGSTFFAAFTGEGLEPLDGRRVFADMNRNGVWDYRETLDEAWRRLGLIRPGERVTYERYIACVDLAAAALAREGFFSAATVARYREEARQIPWPPHATAPGAPAAGERRALPAWLAPTPTAAAR